MPRFDRDMVKAEVEARLRAGEYLTYHAFIEAGTGRAWANRTMLLWHAEGRIHIHHYERKNGGSHLPHYAWGRGKDAPKIRNLTRAEVSRRYRKNNPDAYIRDVNRQKAKRLKAKPPTLDPLMRALMGG